MEYTEVNISLNPILPAREILLYELGEVGFDSFTEEEKGLKAYIPTEKFNESSLQEAFYKIDELEVEYDFELNIIEDKNWNEIWESNIQPIIIDDKCVVKAPFHRVDKHFDYEILIDPKMSFGTGHHETTYLIMQEMLLMNFDKKVVLDMGSGTGILAILACKKGANYCDAIDVEEWAYHNAIENAKNNDVSNMNVFLGNGSLIKDKKNNYDVVLANINRNILLQDIIFYTASMKQNAHLLLSGFYVTDAAQLVSEAEKYNLKLVSENSKNTWCILHFIKN
ncbi:MAG: 50S ribosomal protein L11 methyltransferase [Bacteroidia bacterium]